MLFPQSGVCTGRAAYTGITRAKRLLVVIGQTKALGIAVRNDQSRKRYSGLLSSLNNHEAIQLR